MTHDYSKLSDADLNAAIAVRVCGWRWFLEKKRNLIVLHGPDESKRWMWPTVPGMMVDVTGEESKYERFIDYACCYGDTPTGGPKTMPRWCQDMNDCFEAQSALAAKGEKYVQEYTLRLMSRSERIAMNFELWWHFANVDARTRCEVMLAAVDEIEGAKSS